MRALKIVLFSAVALTLAAPSFAATTKHPAKHAVHHAAKKAPAKAHAKKTAHKVVAKK